MPPQALNLVQAHLKKSAELLGRRQVLSGEIMGGERVTNRPADPDTYQRFEYKDVIMLYDVLNKTVTAEIYLAEVLDTPNYGSQIRVAWSQWTTAASTTRRAWILSGSRGTSVATRVNTSL